MKIVINSKQSIYLELASKIEKLIKLGVYKENEQLPSCRSLGLELGVSPNTVARVYTLLEERGVVYTLPKKGIYVKGMKALEANRDEVILTLKGLKDNNISKDLILECLDEVFGGDADD